MSVPATMRAPAWRRPSERPPAPQKRSMTRGVVILGIGLTGVTILQIVGCMSRQIPQGWATWMLSALSGAYPVGPVHSTICDVDVLTKAQRSFNMSRIGSRWTAQERALHGLLKGRKVRHRMHPVLPGKPDVLVLPDLVVYIHGCFWHGC